MKKFNEFINERKDVETQRFVVEDNKFKLFSNDELVSETGFEIVSEDEWFNEKYVIIFDLKTFEKFLGKGYAEKLLEKIFDYVKKVLKLNIISLIVYKDNYKASKLYFKTGFEIFIEYDDSYSLVKKL